MIVIGIDPGVNGAIAIMRDIGDLEIIDVPTTNGIGKRRAVDRYKLSRIIDAAAKVKIDHAFIEEVHSRPTDGHVGSFMFGRAYEALCMVIAAHFIPQTLVSPVKWRNALGIKRPERAGDKSAVVARACTMFPRYAELWAAKCHSDRAEAALIAEYGRRVLSGKL